MAQAMNERGTDSRTPLKLQTSQFVTQREKMVPHYKKHNLIMFKEIICVDHKNDKKYINTPCGQNSAFLNVT